MSLVVDTTIVIACVLEEPRREILIKLTANEELTAPASLQWEVGNALSAMFKHGRIGLLPETGTR
jgi:predicted nucleic acid-binding protein